MILPGKLVLFKSDLNQPQQSIQSSFTSVPDKRRVSGQTPDGNRYLTWHWRKENQLKYSYKLKYYNYERKQK